MRLAILSDIHGNSIALDAVLQDVAEQNGVDEYWVLGDLVAIGPDPIGVLQRLERLPHASIVRGNTDRYICGDVTEMLPDDVPADQMQLTRLLRHVTSFAWTQGAVAAAGYRPWLQRLPLDVRLTLEDGTRVLGVHASPGEDDGPGFHPGHSDREMRERLSGADADLVFVGHTHWPFSRVLDDVHLVNLGPLSVHPPPDTRAKYVILESNSDGYTIERRYVDYDHAAVIDQLHAAGHPTAERIGQMLNGGLLMPWMQQRAGELADLVPQPFVKRTKYES